MDHILVVLQGGVIAIGRPLAGSDSPGTAASHHRDIELAEARIYQGGAIVARVDHLHLHGQSVVAVADRGVKSKT